jgi:hypothetical protein
MRPENVSLERQAPSLKASSLFMVQKKLSDLTDKLLWLDAKTGGQLEKRCDTRLPLLALQKREGCRMKSCQFS